MSTSTRESGPAFADTDGQEYYPALTEANVLARADRDDDDDRGLMNSLASSSTAVLMAVLAFSAWVVYMDVFVWRMLQPL